MQDRGHETLEHTADMGLCGWGKSPAEALEETALAMFDLILDRRGEISETEYTLSIGGRGLTDLLIEFLNELLSLADVEDTAFVTISIKRLEGSGDEWEMEAVAGGIPRRECRKRLLSEVKAATWYGASVSRRSNGQWMAACVVDI